MCILFVCMKYRNSTIGTVQNLKDSISNSYSIHSWHNLLHHTFWVYIGRIPITLGLYWTYPHYPIWVYIGRIPITPLLQGWAGEAWFIWVLSRTGVVVVPFNNKCHCRIPNLVPIRCHLGHAPHCYTKPITYLTHQYDYTRNSKSGCNLMVTEFLPTPRKLRLGLPNSPPNYCGNSQIKHTSTHVLVCFAMLAYPREIMKVGYLAFVSALV